MRRGCRLQDEGAVQGQGKSRWRVIAHRRGGREARLARGGIREQDAFLGHEMRGPAGAGRGGVSMAGGQEGQGAKKGNGVRGQGAIACHLHHVLFRICLCISAFRLDEKGCWRASFLCTHEFLYILHLFHYFFLPYLIFDFVCLTLSLADTHGIAKYARTYVRRYTHTRTHENKTHTKKEKTRRRNDNQQTTVTHFSENKRLHLDN